MAGQSVHGLGRREAVPAPERRVQVIVLSGKTKLDDDKPKQTNGSAMSQTLS